MVFKTFWREGSGKPYLPPSKTEFYNKIGQSIEGLKYVTKFFWKIEKLILRAKFETFSNLN